MRSVDDLSTRARIRDAALARFGADGVGKATLRAVAADAGVSAPLVLHHFGSKDGLRQECDDFVIGLVEAKIRISSEYSADSSPMAAFGGLLREAGPAQPYIMRLFRDGGPGARRIFELLVDHTEGFLTEFEKRGEVLPCDDPRARAAVMVTWHVGFVVLGDSLAAVLGAPDMLHLPTQMRAGTAMVDLYTRGLFTDDRWMRVTRELAREVAKEAEER